MSQYILSKRAENDIRQIGEYTLNQWGEDQMISYLQGLRETLRKIATSPNTLGRKRSDLKAGYYSSLYQSHVVFFTKQKMLSESSGCCTNVAIFRNS